jgi:hypothetical protein
MTRRIAGALPQTPRLGSPSVARLRWEPEHRGRVKVVVPRINVLIDACKGGETDGKPPTIRAATYAASIPRPRAIKPGHRYKAYSRLQDARETCDATF